MTSPWKTIEPVETANLEDIMSEQVAIDLQTRENKKYDELVTEYHQATGYIPDPAIQVASKDEDEDDFCESDAVIAMMLQKQFDKEYDEELKLTEHKYNRNSKVSISLKNYLRSSFTEPDSESEDEELIDVVDRKDWDRFDNVERSISSIPRCGYHKNQNGTMVTKHDTTLSARKNACKFMSFPPEFQTGDAAGFDVQLSNKVFNSLKLYSKKEQARIHDKRDRATAVLGIDAFTRLLIYKLINNQLLERVNGVISSGKEAVILHAESDPSYTKCALPKECVIKVFKTTLSDFKQRDKYIKDDQRFKGRYGNKQNSRKMVQLWAEKEMANLSRLGKIGLPCPVVVALKQHILVMSFIGNEHIAAPKLKDAILIDADWIIAYEQVLDAMKKLFNEAKLIHADLSEYNILWHDGKCWIIDVSQSVEPIHPNAFNFLYRDCTNISAFFNKRGVPEVKNPKDLFIEITGFDYFDKTALPVSSTVKPKPQLVDSPGMQEIENFETEWIHSQQFETDNKIITAAAKLQLIETPIS